MRENPTLVGALEDYLSAVVKKRRVVSAALAVAGPVLGDVVPLTNSDWVCDKNEVATALGCDVLVRILNDFEAVAVAVGAIDDSEINLFNQGRCQPRIQKIIMGPGTGLGTVLHLSQWRRVLSSRLREGGTSVMLLRMSVKKTL